MPNLSADEYVELQNLLKDPDAKLPDELRQRAFEAIQNYDTKNLTAPAPAEPPLQLTLDPNKSVVSQAVAQTPPTNDPNAETDWLTAGPESAAGAVFVYEPPLAVVKQKLMDNPMLVRALGFEHIPPPTPEQIAAITPDSDLYKAFGDYEWTKASDAATKAGKRAYRYSKTPWLQGGGALSAIESFGLKALGSSVPALESVTAFFLGADDAALLGATRAAGEATEAPADSEGVDARPPKPTGEHYWHPTLGWVPESLGRPQDEVVGGAMGSAGGAREAMDLIEQDHPAAALAGRIAGALSPFGATGFTFGTTARAGRALAGAEAGFGKRVLAATGAAGVAGAGLQAAREGVQALSGLAQGEEPGARLEGAPERIAEGGAVAAGFGLGGEMLGGVLGSGARWTDRRFQGVPERVMRTNAAEIRPLEGLRLSPETQAVIKRAEGSGNFAGDLLAKDISPKILEGAKREVADAKAFATARKQEYFSSREGQQRLPSTNLIQRSVEILRRKHDAPRGEGALKTVDVSAMPKKVKAILNNEIGTVSTRPSEGAIKLTPEEAESFLSASWQARLGSAKSAEGLASSLHRRGVREVYVVPRRHTAEKQQEVIDSVNGYHKENPTMRELKELDQAARLDRDQWTLNGAPGGWSALQNEHADLIGAAKKLEKLAAPGGDPTRPLTRVQTPRRGERWTVEALQKAADRGGVREQLETLRLLDPLQKLREQTNFGSRGHGGDRLPFGPNALIDAASLRAYPMLRAGGDPAGPLRGGRAGAGAPGLSLIPAGAPVIEEEQP